MAGPSTPTSTPDLLEQVAALKHDLGKYVAWTSANLEDAVWTGPVGDELVSALCADLLATRTHGESKEAAWEVWRSHRASLPEALEPELAAVEVAVAVLEDAGTCLRLDDREALAAKRSAVREAQMTIRAQLRGLHRRLLRER